MTNSTALSATQMQTLAALADAIVPPSTAHCIPGAGDPAICQEIAGSARKPERLADALAALDAMSDAAHGCGFVELANNQRAAVAEAFRDQHASAAGLVEALTMQAYYRDDRVMASLGMDVRAPFPEGYNPPEGDWSLLDPVRRRAPLYRKAD